MDFPKKNPSPDLGPSDPDLGLGVVAIAVEPGWKTIRVVLFVVTAHPRVGSITGVGGDESTSRRRRSFSMRTRSTGLALSAGG
jgi:hypothetical protein